MSCIIPVMDTLFNHMEKLTASVKEYVDLRIESIKLKTAEKSSLLVSNILAGLAVVMVLASSVVAERSAASPSATCGRCSRPSMCTFCGISTSGFWHRFRIAARGRRFITRAVK